MGGTAGKLRAAARWLLTAADGDDFAQDAAAEAELRKIGVPQAQIDAQRAHRAPQGKGDFRLWVSHQVPFRVFGAMRRQVRTRGLLVMGLDLAVLPIVEQRLGLQPLSAEQLEALDILGDECADVMNEELQQQHHG